MKKRPIVVDESAREQGDSTMQGDLFPLLDFKPRWPRNDTMPAEALRRMLDGERLTQPSFGFHGWRLSAYIKELEYLGWLIRRADVAPPFGFKTHKPIREYWLSPEVICLAATIRGKAA